MGLMGKQATNHTKKMSGVYANEPVHPFAHLFFHFKMINGIYRQISYTSRTISQNLCLSSRIAVVFAQSIEAMC